MTDIVEQLRELGRSLAGDYGYEKADCCNEAADEIERLRTLSQNNAQENGLWIATTSDWRFRYRGHDALYIAAGRLRLRLMKRASA